MWPPWPPLAVATDSCAVLTHAGDCSDLLSWQDGQTGGMEMGTGMRVRYTRIEPRAAISCEGPYGRRRGAWGTVVPLLVLAS